MNHIDNICIRPCRAEDLATAHKIDRHIPIEVDLEWLKNNRKANPDLFYVACDSHGGVGVLGDAIEGIVGYISGKPYIEKDSGYISRLAVVPNYRKHGVGTMLINSLEYAFSLYRKYKNVYVETRKSSTDTIRFYTALGYVHLPNFDDPEGYAPSDDPYMITLSKPLQVPDKYRFNACVFMD